MGTPQEKAAQRLLDISLSTMKDGREIFFLFLPNNEDPDTFVRTNGKDAFIEQINNAQPLEDFLFETAGKDIDITTDSGKAKLSKIILPKTKKLPDGIYKQLLLNRLSKKTGLSVENFNQSNIKNTTQKKAIKEKVIVKDNIPIGLEKTPIVWAISLLIHYPNLANEEPLPKCFEEIKTPEAKLLNKLIKIYIGRESNFNNKSIIGALARHP